ncbi:hypothetical protein KKG90_11595 [Candidatus Bipolaricaulota bacterium]|nr:hypothetical protein [Candidatus Bipolaricaulota bacterium]
MNRLVEPRPRGTKTRILSSETGDSYLERVAKYVPAEIVAAYLAIIGFAVSVPSGKLIAMILAFAVCLIATPLYLWRMGKGSKVKAVHLIISSIAFVVWAFAVGGAGGIFGADALNIYEPSWASIVLVIFTLASGLIEPREAA